MNQLKTLLFIFLFILATKEGFSQIESKASGNVENHKSSLPIIITPTVEPIVDSVPIKKQLNFDLVEITLNRKLEPSNAEPSVTKLSTEGTYEVIEINNIGVNRKPAPSDKKPIATPISTNPN